MPKNQIIGTAKSAIAPLVLVTQASFLLLRRQPARAWWRVGAGFAVLMLLVAQPVWEGYPGAATRVLLPMTLAFNLLVPRGRRWLPILLLGNLSAIVGVNEFSAPPHENFVVSGESAVRARLKLERGTGWYVAEGSDGRQWRWSSGTARLRLINRSAEATAVRLRGEITTVRGSQITIRAAGVVVWTGAVGIKRREFESTEFTLPPGAALRVEFSADVPGVAFVEGDARVLAFAVYDMDIAVARAESAAKPAISK